MIKLLCLIILSSVFINIEDDDLNIRGIYVESGISDYITYDVFRIAVEGKNSISMIKKPDILTIIDLTKPSTSERLFIIDIENRKLNKKSLVAHGKNSGENYATTFSNSSRSLKSSLGFYLTGETYYGKHGYSLRLDGLEKGFNDNARKRAIVIHGASYVSVEFAKKYGRLGRSWGCPALPLDISKEIIDEIKNGSCLFIYAKDEEYLSKSEFVN